jgi:hypothetical protein
MLICRMLLRIRLWRWGIITAGQVVTLSNADLLSMQ